MRVLLLTPGAYGVNGGIALYNRDIVEALALIETVTEIVVLPQEMQRARRDVPNKVRQVESALGGRGRFILAAIRQLAQPFDLIVVGHINLMPLAVALNMKWRAKLALMVYGIDVWTKTKAGFDMLAKRADAIWSISEVTTNRMNSWAKLDCRRYVQLPNAIHLEHYAGNGNASAVRERHDLVGRKVLMTLARLPEFERYKGVDEVLECLPALRAEDPSIAYLVVGDGEDRPRLEEKARVLGVAEHVRFVGYIEEAQKPDYYRAADLFVMPGRGEGFGFVFLEALACGVPCVGSGIDGSKEALRDGMLGEIPDPRELDQVVIAIKRALLAPRGVPDGLSYFAWPKFCQRVRESVSQLLGATLS
jgi:phosphatidyl-myo-inositol dimannoside synthase